MKKNPLFNVLGAIALIVTVFFLSACDPTDPNNPDNPDPDDPTPTELVKPDVYIGTAENVTENTAKLVAWVKPNEKGTKISFEYKTLSESNFHPQAISGNYTGTDSIKITFDLSNLTVNSEYLFRVKAANKAGETVSSESRFSTYVVRDYDGNLYHVVKIGNQYWLQENLRTTHFTDGTAIANVTGNEQWAHSTSPAYCYYDNNASNKDKFGALYNGYTIGDKKFIAGYHLPTEAEFNALLSYIGGKDKVNKLTDAGNYGELWLSSATDNSTGLTIVPSGMKGANRILGESSFSEKGLRANLWIEGKDSNTQKLVQVRPDYCENEASTYFECGCSIRLLKD